MEINSCTIRSNIEELNYCMVLASTNGNVAVVRGKYSQPVIYGVVIAKEGDWVYFRNENTKSDLTSCVRFQVGKFGTIDVNTVELCSFPIVLSAVPISDLKDIQDLDSLHYVAKCYLVDPVLANSTVTMLATSEEIYSIQSLHRSLNIIFRGKNKAMQIYDDEPFYQPRAV